ncbi:MAG: 2-C-methyl-D-erythritol 2,4-cyclodiphosphate synthase [Candidatus Omnitrophota bacterium]
MRVGFGYDIHRLEAGRKLFLCGVEIPHEKGLIGHSDADSALHAIADALLGASGLGDIGEHFPNSDPAYKDIRSSELLKKVYSYLVDKELTIGNVDVMIIAEQPSIQPFKSAMREAVAKALMIDVQRVNIKATTNEGVGLVGSGDAIASYAVVSLRER